MRHLFLLTCLAFLTQQASAQTIKVPPPDFINDGTYLHVEVDRPSQGIRVMGVKLEDQDTYVPAWSHLFWLPKGHPDFHLLLSGNYGARHMQTMHNLSIEILGGASDVDITAMERVGFQQRFIYSSSVTIRESWSTVSTIPEPTSMVLGIITLLGGLVLCRKYS